jgi:thiamine transport system substrate-binding protein
MKHVRHTLLAVTATIALAACSAPADSSPTGSSSATTSSATAPTEPRTVRVVTHDSFALSEDLVTAFEESSGITVEFIPAGDAGEMVNRAVLSSGNPEADVLFGIDTTLLSRAIDAEVFDPYLSSADALRPELRDAGLGVVTPVDDGDVCVNIDDAWFADRGLQPPATLEDLADPRYRGLLVVQNPATSSPGLAFLLATIARYGEAWPDFWQRLRDNDVAVVNGWSEAYLSEFTAGGGDGDRPLVVSYSTSPPAEIVYAEEPKPERPSTSVMLDGCYRQVEFAGVLRGTDDVEAARTVVDWLVSPDVQADVPLSMFVFPARASVALPDVFARFVTRPAEPLELDAGEIAAQRDEWIDQWTQIVLR